MKQLKQIKTKYTTRCICICSRVSVSESISLAVRKYQLCPRKQKKPRRFQRVFARVNCASSQLKDPRTHREPESEYYLYVVYYMVHIPHIFVFYFFWVHKGRRQFCAIFSGFSLSVLTFLSPSVFDPRRSPPVKCVRKQQGK